MKKSRALISAVALASAALVSQSAYAGKIDTETSKTIELIGNVGTFGNLLTGGNSGQSFSDRYLFTTSGVADLNAELATRSGNIKNGLDITGFALYNAAGELLGSTALAKGISEIFTLSVDNLAAGSYYLQINGSLRSNAAGRYLGNLAIAIPEPATYALMLGGLGLVGFAARRRKPASKAHA
jgi:hypothetical protein